MRTCVAVLLSLLLSSPLTPAFAIGVSPISAELDLARARTHLLTVFNSDQAGRVAVKVSVRSWALDKTGADQRGDTDDLVVFPGQFVLGPGERRSVRVAPRVEQSPEVEKSYRVMVEELPVDLDQQQARPQTGVRVVTAYATAFYVRPLNPRSSLRLTGVDRSGEELVFRMLNEGNAHTHLRKLALVFDQDGRRVRIDDPEPLSSIMNANLLAGSERHLAWKWAPAATAGVDVNRPFDLRLELECESCETGRAALSISVP